MKQFGFYTENNNDPNNVWALLKSDVFEGVIQEEIF